MTTRLQVLKALCDALRTINPANGYTFDVGTSVFRGRSRFGKGDPIPMLTLVQDPSQDAQYTPAQVLRVGFFEFSLVIQGFVEDDFDNPTDPAEVLLYEVKRALLAHRTDGNILGLGATIERMDIGVGVTSPPITDVSDKAFFALPIRLRMIESFA